MKVLLIAIAILFIGCNGNVQQDERIVLYAEIVQYELSDRGVYFDLDMNLFVSDIKESKGVWGFSRGDDIYIEREVLEMSELRIVGLLAHEIGHNKFGLKHPEREKVLDIDGNIDIMHISSFQFVSDENIGCMFDKLAKDIAQ